MEGLSEWGLKRTALGGRVLVVCTDSAARAVTKPTGGSLAAAAGGRTSDGGVLF